jgi:hypothetical protein
LKEGEGTVELVRGFRERIVFSFLEKYTGEEGRGGVELPPFYYPYCTSK